MNSPTYTGIMGRVKGRALLIALVPFALFVGHGARVTPRSPPETISFATVQAPSIEPDYLVIENFEGDELGALPRTWEWRGWGEVTEKPYRVVEENGNRFLRAEDSGQNVILYKGFRWDLEKYPFLRWRWRIRAVPEGADERVEELADSAAGLYLTYRKTLGLIPRSIKFVWSATLAEGTAFRRPGVGMPWTVVAGSGDLASNEWRTFTFDAREAYRKTYGGNPGDRPLGVGVLSDANNTRTRAFADYDDIIVLKVAESPQRIRDVIPPQ